MVGTLTVIPIQLLPIDIPQDREVGKREGDVYLTPRGKLVICQRWNVDEREEILLDWDSVWEATDLEYRNYASPAVNQMLETYQAAVQTRQAQTQKLSE